MRFYFAPQVCKHRHMTIFQSFIFLILFVPAFVIAGMTVVEAQRLRGRDRPLMSDATWGTGDYGGGDGGGGGGDGGGG